MAHAPRERLAKLLDDAESPGAFSAQLLVPADSLHLAVEGVGQIRLPVRAPQARKLCDVARPARFGVGEQTLTDASVRDTWEIPPELVTITGTRWAATLESVLDEVRDQLGLPLSSRLAAELHAMLVYGPGQFFLPHQDSEKDDVMIGTLVVTPAVLAHRRRADRRAWQPERRVPLVEGLAVVRGFLRRLPPRGQTGEVRLPGHAHLQSAHVQRQDWGSRGPAGRRTDTLPHRALHDQGRETLRHR